MQTRNPQPKEGAVPPLHNGDRLTQAEFHRRYEASPPHVRAELIGGIVHMSSPVGQPHGTYHLELSVIGGIYKAATPGVHGGVDTTTILGKKSEPQPDLLLGLLPEYQGQQHLNPDRYLVGAPEFVGEIAYSSVAIDFGRKRRDYLAAGVQEYFVLCIEEQQIHWFHFPSRKKLRPDRNGIWKSKVFPGLWIETAALLACNTARSIEVIQQGIASPEHVAFVEKLQRMRSKHKP